MTASYVDYHNISSFLSTFNQTRMQVSLDLLILSNNTLKTVAMKSWYWFTLLLTKIFYPQTVISMFLYSYIQLVTDEKNHLEIRQQSPDSDWLRYNCYAADQRQNFQINFVDWAWFRDLWWSTRSYQDISHFNVLKKTRWLAKYCWTICPHTRVDVTVFICRYV